MTSEEKPWVLSVKCTQQEFDQIALHDRDVALGSPTFREACLSLGVTPDTDLMPRFLEYFYEPGIDPELQALRAEHFETRRQERVRSVLACRKNLLEEQKKRGQRAQLDAEEVMEFGNEAQGSPIVTARQLGKGSPRADGRAGGSAFDDELIAREQRQLEKIKMRQKQELEQMMAYEMKVASFQKQNDVKMERERRLREEHEERQRGKQRKREEQRYQRELDRKAEEKEKERMRRKAAEKLHQANKRLVEREKSDEVQRKLVARSREVERAQKKEDLNAQTQAIMREKERQIQKKKREMAQRDEDRIRAIEERRLRKANEQAEVLRQQRERVRAARTNQRMVMERKHESFEERQRKAEERQRRFQEEQDKHHEQLRRMAERKAEDIAKTKQQMHRIQKQKKDAILQHEELIDARLEKRYKDSLLQRVISQRQQAEKDNERQQTYEQMQKNQEDRKKRVLEIQQAKLASAERMQIAMRKRNRLEDEKRRLREMDRKDALVRQRRKEEFLKSKIVKKIAETNARAERMQAEREYLIEQRREFRKQAEIDREKVLRNFEKMKRTGNLDSILIPGSEQSISTSRSAFPLTQHNKPGDFGSLGSPMKVGLPKSARRPHSAKPRKSHGWNHGVEKGADENGGFRLKGGRTAKKKKNRVVGVSSSGNRSSTTTPAAAVAEGKSGSSVAEQHHVGLPAKNNQGITDGASSVDSLRRAQNSDLLLILGEEQIAEEKREKLYKQVKDPKEKRQLEKVFGIERAKASARIMQTAELHERRLEKVLKEQELMG